jgi:dihydrofolate synthase/folylpolyglutamate synthase
MFNDIETALSYVMSRMSISEGFEHYKKVMKKLNSPENNLKFIHVAGTNGKGSYVAYMMNTLINQGLKVGTFQSPHLITHLDRIRINNINMDSESFLKYLNKYLVIIEEENLNMFEIDFLIMCEYFDENDVDIVLLEVGLGGRLDATNIIKTPLISIITNIGYDHQDLLGNTLELIAFEKAGIIKKNCPVLIGLMDDSITEVFKNVCKVKDSDLKIVSKIEINKGYFFYKKDKYYIGSLAKYQMRNASLVIESVSMLNELYGYNISITSLKKSLKETIWKGRFQIIEKNPLVIMDGAHNEDGISALVESFDLLPRPIIVVCSFLKDKNYQRMSEILIENADSVIFTTFDFTRALDIDTVFPKMVEKYEHYDGALERAYNTVGKGTIVICGSLYFISEILRKKTKF